MGLIDVMRSVGGMLFGGKEGLLSNIKLRKRKVMPYTELIERVDLIRLMSRDVRYVAKLYQLNVDHPEIINALSEIRDIGSVTINDDLLSDGGMFMLAVRMRAVDINEIYCTCNRFGYDLLYIRELMK